MPPPSANVPDHTHRLARPVLRMMLASSEQTGGAYTLIEELCPRGSGPPPHWHEQHELFYVIDGEVTFSTGEDERRVAGPGSFVFIPSGTVHSFRVDSETCRLLNGYTPAGFEKVIYTLGVPAETRTLPPRGIDKPIDPEVAGPLFAEVGMHGAPGARDVLREEHEPG